MGDWTKTLELSDQEIRLLRAVAETEELTIEEWARKTLWQMLRLNTPSQESEQLGLFPPGWDKPC
jgi:predicted transcriptional regulator